jgi:hypothetical protein
MAQSAGEAAGRARQKCTSQGSEEQGRTPRQGPATCSLHTWPRPPGWPKPNKDTGGEFTKPPYLDLQEGSCDIT